jgi:hypothetical protein
MKSSSILTAVLSAVALSSAYSTYTAYADGLGIVDTNYATPAYYTDPQSNDIVSFDWTSSGDLAYMTQSAGYNFTGVYLVSAGHNSTVDPGNLSDYAGASVVTIGDYVYYNYSYYNFTTGSSSYYINKYGPTNGTASATQASTVSNFGLYQNSGRLFITAEDANGVNDIYYSNPGSTGSLASIVDIGVTSGASGPLAFDAQGDLYYAPGDEDTSIYRWSAATVAAAIANPTTHPLTTAGHLWVNYGSNPNYSSELGATSMLVNPDGDVLVTLTDFSSTSDMVDFSDDGQDATTILTDTEPFGQLLDEDGTDYFSAGDEIYELESVPEPSAIPLLILGSCVALVACRVRKSKAVS